MKKNQYELIDGRGPNTQLLCRYVKHGNEKTLNEPAVPFVGYEGEDRDGNVYSAVWLNNINKLVSN